MIDIVKYVLKNIVHINHNGITLRNFMLKIIQKVIQK